MAATVGKTWAAVVSGMLIALSIAAPAFGQGVGLPPAPVPVLPPPAPPPGSTTLGPPQPWNAPSGVAVTPSMTAPSMTVPPPPPPSSLPPPLYQPHDPGPNGWGPYCGPSDEPAFIVNAELQIIAPALKNRLTHNLPLPDGSTVTVAPGGADLRTTVSPELEIGYRLSESLGQFTLGYRFIATDGTANVNDGMGSSVRTRLNVNIVDFDYSTARYEPVPHWDMKWWIGLRYATNFFDNHQTNAFTDIHDSNYFNGAGPHAALEVQRHIGPLPAFAVFAKADGAVMLGQLRQRFSQMQLDSFGNPEMAETDERKTQSVPMIDLRAGVSYSPPKWENLRISAGYQFEQWWYLGQLGDSRGELHSNGGFVRMELDF